MYEISPNKSFASQEGVGHYENQVINPAIASNAIQQKAAFVHADQLARRKRQEDLIDKAAEFDSSVLKPNDIPAIAKQQDDLMGWLKNKMSINGELSVADQLEFNRKKADIKTQALNSAAAKNYANELLKKAAVEPAGTYDEGDIKNIQDFLSHPEHAGNVNTSALSLNKNFDYGKHVLANLAPAADRIASNNAKQGVENFTPEQAKDMIADDLKDPVKYRAVSKLVEADKAAGILPADYHDVLGYAQEKYAPTLVSNKTPYRAPQTNVNIAAAKQEEKLPVVSHTLSDNKGIVSLSAPLGDKQEMKRASSAEYTIGDKGAKHFGDVLLKSWEHDKNGNVIKGYGLALTPEQKRKNDATEAKYRLEEKAYLDGKTSVIPVKGEILLPTTKVVLSPRTVTDLAQTQFGVDPDEINKAKGAERIIGGASYHRNKYAAQTPTTAPKQGDERPVQGGTAVFNGTKWVMKQ